MNSRMTNSQPEINSLNALLSDIYVRYVALDEDEFREHYKVFNDIFYSLHSQMKEVDRYYERYSGMVQFAGSHYDRLRIKKPDEFDMDVVIGLPLNIEPDKINRDNSDIIIEPKDPGFVQLKMGKQFTNLPNREDWEIHQTCYKWKDDDDYLLRSKFIDWFKSVVRRAFNKFPPYNNNKNSNKLTLSESGPAVTLKIRNEHTGFKMDVDLVPALRFPESRWPITQDYRAIPRHCEKDFWMVVPKPNNIDSNDVEKSRSWRVALHYQERELIYDSKNLRTAIKLLKKLRDEQDMSKIASYYIKTLVYLEVVRRDDKFGSESLDYLFKLLIDKFYEALTNKNLPFFWNKNNNLFVGINDATLEIYANKVKNLKRVLEVPSDYKKVAKFLLTADEFNEYNLKNLHL